ncbi:MAG: TolC family protein [Pseudomonadales bacterium]
MPLAELLRLSKLLVIPLLLGITACASNTQPLPEQGQLVPKLPEQFSISGEGELPLQWWQNFDDTQLNQWVELGLQSNNSLAASIARLDADRAVITQSHSKRFPDLQLSGNVAGRRIEGEQLYTSRIGLDSSWELDLWGRLSSLEDRSRWDYFGGEATTKLRANLVAGNISQTWYSWVSEFEKDRLLTEQYDRVERALLVIRKRFSLGNDSATDIWQQERLLESIHTQQLRTRRDLELNRQRLANWVGVSVDRIPASPNGTLPQLQALPDTGLVVNALIERPDIQRAYASLRSADASLATAVADRLPRITLRASADSVRAGSSELFDAWITEIAAGLVMPIFDAGQRRAVVDQREALRSAALSDYRQSWFDAIMEVEDALTRNKYQVEVVESIETQLQLARKTEGVSRLSYLVGSEDYLRLLRSQETTLFLERQYVDAQLLLVELRIALYRSLSHGEFITPGKDTDIVSRRSM